MKRMTFFLSAAALWASALILSAQEPAPTSAEQKLDAAVERLATLRQEIATQKRPLANQRQTLLDELRDIRQEAARMRRLSDNSQTDLNALQANVDSREENLEYLLNFAIQYVRTFDSRLPAQERELYGADLAAALTAVANKDAETPERIKAMLEVVGAGIDRAERLVGGDILPGRAIGPDNLERSGNFAMVGPVTFFAAGPEDTTGIVQASPSGSPEVLAVEKGAFDEAILALTNGEQAAIPMDPTLGNALAIASTQETLVEHIQKGGVWIYPILGFAALSLIMAIIKFIQLGSLPKANKALVGEVLDKLASGEDAEAAKAARNQPGPIGEMMRDGVRNAKRDPELIEEVMYQRIFEVQPEVMRLLPFISVTAAVAPLLGLLGTVTGIINTFNMIQIFGTGDPKTLSGGISEALVTTEFGLIVAIPSLIFYAFLSRKAKGYLTRMEQMAIAFLNGVKIIRSGDYEPGQAVGDEVSAKGKTAREAEGDEPGGLAQPSPAQ